MGGNQRRAAKWDEGWAMGVCVEGVDQTNFFLFLGEEIKKEGKKME